MLKCEQVCSIGKRIISTEPIKKGQVVYKITDFRIQKRQDHKTVQIGENEHLISKGILEYINHSCAPNTIVNTITKEVVAYRDIAEDEEITFFYPSTEWDMARPFVCLCGARNCIRLVAGAKYLNVEVLLQHFINKHIIDKIVHELETLQRLCVMRPKIAPRHPPHGKSH